MRVLFYQEVFCTPVWYSLAVWRTVPMSTKFCWALSDQKGMSYLAKKNSLTKRAYTDHKIYKKCKDALMMSLDFVLLDVVKRTDSYAEGREITVPPQ